MSDPLTQAGAVKDQSRFAPLWVNEFWTGLYTNSNPLREGAVPYLYQKFYSGARFETMRGGQNVEISQRLTPIRRPGNSVYNSQTFPAINTFYAFRPINSNTGQTQIIVIADTVATVYNATGPNTQFALFSKSSTAGQTSFQQVGNTLYAADGVSAWKWLWFNPWVANNSYTLGATILDPNNNLQKSLGFGLAISSTSVTSNIATINFFTSVNNINIGDTVTFYGLTTKVALNGASLTVLGKGVIGGGGTFITVSYVTANYGTTSDTGFAVDTSVTTSTSGATIPTFSATVGGLTIDGTPNSTIWQCKGNSVQNWGIVAPTTAPTVGVTALPAASAWVATTYYWPHAFIVDSNGATGPWIWSLTTDGTTAAGVPGGLTAGTPTPQYSGGTISASPTTVTDGTAVWTCNSLAARATSTKYSFNQTILVSWTYVYYTYQYSKVGIIKIPHDVTYMGFFQCTAAGTTSSTATSAIPWNYALNSTVIDGGVTWKNVGLEVTRLAAATSSPSGGGISNMVAGNVSNTVAITQVSEISDSNNNGEFPIVAGITGAAHPTWATATGASTVEASGLTWANAGVLGAANTGAWLYSYAYSNSVTGHVSSSSPASVPIILPASSGITISGPGDPNFAKDFTDQITIYRTTQAQTTLFFLTTIPAPLLGAAWSFTDTTPDPPVPGAILNEFITADTTGNNTPPPAGLHYLTYYLNAIFGSSATFEYRSGPATQAVGVGVESFPGTNFWQLPTVITQSWPSPAGLLIFTQFGIYFSSGVDSSGNPLKPTRTLDDIGLLTPNLFTVNGSTPVILTSDSQLLSLDPSTGLIRFSDPIADIIGGFSNTSSFLTWHTNGIDSAYHLADGSTGWYRLAPTASPESGFTWSPKANIVGGAGCVMSIETTIGNKQLLIGPQSSGVILARNTTTWQDGGTTYPASFIIGSVVLAQPGECAEVESVSTIALKLGSRITVSVMGNEISGQTASPPFEQLETQVTEPPFLTVPATLYSDRWYFSQLKQPAWLMHMQIQFTWPAENFQNELLAFSIYGAVHTEG